MSDLLRTCATCGELTEQTYCPEHAPKQKSNDRLAAGYDAAWQRLSRQARREQPFCTECGATDDLTLDHSPEAWERKRAGRAITLDLVTVLCRPCNSSKGKAR